MWGEEGSDSEVQQGRPGSRGDAFMVMADQANLSTGADFWAGKSKNNIEKGAYMPTWHVACRIQWIYVKNYGGLGTGALALKTGSGKDSLTKNVAQRFDVLFLAWPGGDTLRVARQKWCETDKTGKSEMMMLSVFGCTSQVTKAKSRGLSTESSVYPEMHSGPH